MIWHKILATARYTPSPHNVQPWKVRIIDEFKAELFIDQSRTLPAEDVTGSFILSAIGMFLEALKIISLNEGMTFHYELIESPDSLPMKPFAYLFLEPNAAAQSIYSNDIFLRRRTSRLPSKRQQIPNDVLRKLSSLAQQWGQKFEWMNSTADINELVEQNITALFCDLNDPAYHDEIVTWFRYTRREGQLKKDGLEARCMKVPGIEFYLFAKFPFILKLPGISLIARNHYRKRLGHVHTVGLIAGSFWDKKDALSSGAFLIHFWLEMTQHDLFIHPFGNVVTNHEANRWIHAKTGLEHIWLVFRMGYSEPAPQSHRLNVEDICLDPIH